MSEHSEVRITDERYPDTCTCMWRAYGARDRIDAWSALQDHIRNEQGKSRAAAAAKKERVRLLTQGQNWDMP